MSIDSAGWLAVSSAIDSSISSARKMPLRSAIESTCEQSIEFTYIATYWEAICAAFLSANESTIIPTYI